MLGPGGPHDPRAVMPSVVRSWTAADGTVLPRSTTVSLADEFRQAQLDICAELRRDTPYNPSRFEQAVRATDGPGAVAFTRRLIVTGGEGASGYRRMCELDRKHQTIEAQVVEPYWAQLFDRDTIAAAQWRLDLPDPTRPA